MIENALYKLDSISDDPRYEGFAFVRRKTLRGAIGGKGSIEDDFDPDPEEVRTQGRAWRVPRLAGIWTPQRVVGRVNAYNDYPCVAPAIPAFSRRAVDALRHFLEPNGELLPLVSKVGEYYVYNVTTVANVLDERLSHVRTAVPGKEWYQWLPEPNPRKERYDCIPDRMAGLSIFRLVDDFTAYCVTQRFVDRVREYGLNGFHFDKLWPLPPGVNWWDLHLQELDKKKRITTSRGSIPVKGNTVVVCIQLAGEKPTNAERQRRKKLLDQIDAMLHDPTAPPDAPLLGSLEGDEFVEGESRLFLSCPDADVLVEKLRQWLKKVSREVPIRVLKRYGEYVDSDAPGEWVEL